MNTLPKPTTSEISCTIQLLGLILLVAVLVEGTIAGYIICWVFLPKETAIFTLMVIFVWSTVSLQTKNRRIRQAYAKAGISIYPTMWGGVKCEDLRLHSERWKHGYGERYNL